MPAELIRVEVVLRGDVVAPCCVEGLLIGVVMRLDVVCGGTSSKPSGRGNTPFRCFRKTSCSALTSPLWKAAPLVPVDGGRRS